MWMWTLWIWATKYFFTPGVGCFGAATILIAQHKPCHLFTVLRSIDLELLTVPQLEEVQHEMKLSQLLLHPNITCYICSFVVDTKLWAVQPLMHYGKWVDAMCVLRNTWAACQHDVFHIWYWSCMLLHRWVQLGCCWYTYMYFKVVGKHCYTHFMVFWHVRICW